MVFRRVKEAIDDIAAGKMIILVDDEDRENEGDLCLAADKVTPEAINFMATHARGLICLTLTGAQCKRLDLPLMVESNTSMFQTGFTVSVEAKEGVTTGISAKDRAHTIRVAIRGDACPEDLVRPGHVFPIRARDGGVLVRAGQTEGSVDLARLADLPPAGVICEIMNEDGTMARRPELQDFAKKHGLCVVSIAELIQYRLAHESLVELVVEHTVETRWGPVAAKVFRSIVDGTEHLALVKGTIHADEPTLVRVQSIELPADLVGIALSGGGVEQEAAMRLVERAGSGVFVYLVRPSHARISERLLDLVNTKRRAPRIGGRMDFREFGIGAQILKFVGVRRFRLMSNHDVRLVGIEGFDLERVDRVPLFREDTMDERGQDNGRDDA